MIWLSYLLTIVYRSKGKSSQSHNPWWPLPPNIMVYDDGWPAHCRAHIRIFTTFNDLWFNKWGPFRNKCVMKDWIFFKTFLYSFKFINLLHRLDAFPILYSSHIKLFKWTVSWYLATENYKIRWLTYLVVPCRVIITLINGQNMSENQWCIHMYHNISQPESVHMGWWTMSSGWIILFDQIAVKV